MEIEDEKLPEEQANGEYKPPEEPLLQTSGAAISTNVPNVLETDIAMTSERISTDSNHVPTNQHPNDVRFKVKYKKDFEGEKNFEEGAIQIVSRESAEHFAKLGMGSIIK